VKPWRYTDDTEMAIGVAEALVKDRRIVAESLCEAWVANCTPGRPYGASRLVLEAMARHEDHRAVAENLFPGGSFGNGAAMRVAPVGLFFRDHPDRAWDEARLSALPTHVHPLAIEGAQLIAAAVAFAVRQADIDRDAFLADLQRRSATDAFRARLQLARQLRSRDELPRLGNHVVALDSVVTAIACFAFSPDSYPQTVADAVFLGGDTDTIAAMAGAISGARLGKSAIPPALLEAVEDEKKGRSYLADLAVRLCEASV
jgi:poly(ADP-ribose) glycohydrolase ARH3